MTAITFTTAENAAVREARDVPQLIDNLTVANPAMAAQFTGKALIASKTPWGTVLFPIVAYAASRFGFGWSQDVDALIAGGAVIVGSYVMRAVTSVPIRGWFQKPVAVAVVPTPS